MTETNEYLLRLLRAALGGQEAPMPPAGLDQNALIEAADTHRVAALCASAIQGGDPTGAFEKRLMGARYTDAIQHFAIEELSALFTERHIEHCFFKGTDIKAYYAAPYLREMLDVDVIVKPRSWRAACEILRALGYQDDHDGELHTVFFRGDIKLELHRELLSEQSPHVRYDQAMRRGLVKCAGSRYRYEMPIREQYLFVILHAEKHIVSARFLLRFLTDLAVMRRLPGFAAWREELAPALEGLGLSAFTRYLEALADGWFMGAPMDEDTEAVGSLLLSWGAPISEKEVVYKREWSWFLYNRFPKSLLYRLFPTFTMLFACRPELGSQPWLTPFVYLWYQIRPFVKLYPRHASVMKKAGRDVSDAFKNSLDRDFAVLYGEMRVLQKNTCQTDKAMLK